MTKSKESSMTLLDLIKIVDPVYPDGAIMQAHLDKNFSGDTLAKFIAAELASTFDDKKTRSKQLDDAAEAMWKANDQISDVIDAIDVATMSAEDGARKIDGRGF